MKEPITYSDITTYSLCPRRWVWQRANWQWASLPEEMIRGSLVHASVAALLQGKDTRAARQAVLQENLELSKSNPALQVPDWEKVNSEAQGLFMAWQIKLAASIKLPCLLVEETLSLEHMAQKIGGTPDAVAIINGKPSILELKTTGSPRIEHLDITGQADYYAWLFAESYQFKEQLWVALDIVTPEYVFRHHRPARLQQGAYLAARATAIAQNAGPHMLGAPAYGWWCRTCPYQAPCKAYDSGEDANDLLLQGYWEATSKEQERAITEGAI